MTNESQFTRFSGSGGGQLAGYPADSEPGQYRVNQYFVETTFKYHGFSWQQEYHWKSIDDQINNDTRTLSGNYIQLGTFPATYINGFPEPLEVAGRYTYYRPDEEIAGLLFEEVALNFNWFFKGHLNKLSTEVSYLEGEDNEVIKPGWRFRFQWEISF